MLQYSLWRWGHQGLGDSFLYLAGTRHSTGTSKGYGTRVLVVLNTFDTKLVCIQTSSSYKVLRVRQEFQ